MYELNFIGDRPGSVLFSEVSNVSGQLTDKYHLLSIEDDQESSDDLEPCHPSPIGRDLMVSRAHRHNYGLAEEEVECRL